MTKATQRKRDQSNFAKETCNQRTPPLHTYNPKLNFRKLNFCNSDYEGP